LGKKAEIDGAGQATGIVSANAAFPARKLKSRVPPEGLPFARK
jgi:hypothetical protein